ncbi:MAG: transcription antitermination factor NusB [Flavobacteriales bacterium]|nr:transcription antitermination factor NusB [Flavobacteriales bacterium]
MLNRRLIRIKVFQVVYAHLQDETGSMNKAKSYLKNSIRSIDNNFFTVVLFPLELIHFIRTKLDPSDTMYLPKAEDISAYKALNFNGLYEKIVQNEEVASHLARPNYKWETQDELLRNTYRKIRADERFAEFLSKTELTEEEAQAALISIYEFVIDEMEEFNHQMEEIDMLWEDEKDAIKKAVKSYVKDLCRGKKARVPSKDDETDWEFAEQLFDKSVRNTAEFENMIASSAAKWDKDRIAKTDMVLMTMALTEFVDFPYIPIKVTMNEYLELAKEYSTPQSSKFVNGILDKLQKQLKAENRLIKKGRGMVG